MKKLIHLLTSTLILLAALPLSAQTAREYLREDPTRSGNLHHHYEVPEQIINTPAPAGYTAFYVSHYGRHGSRFQTSSGVYNRLMPYLNLLKDERLLTEEGKEAVAILQRLYDEHNGMDGILTQRGGAEHQGIAQRLYDRVPEVFHQPGRWRVMAASTTVPRVLQSMANFTNALKGNAPQLYFNFYTGDRFGNYICDYRNDTSRDHAMRVRAVTDSVSRVLLNPDRLMHLFFTDVDKVTELIATALPANTTNPSAAGVAASAPRMLDTYTPRSLLTTMFSAANIANCLDGDVPDLTKFYTEDELYAFWYLNNMSAYNSFSTSVENEGVHTITGQKILRDIVIKADEAIVGNDKCADLRFGHDSGLGPLLSLIQVEGYDKVLPIAEAPEVWKCFKMLPMGSNLQIIFYRNDEDPDDIIVRMLRNDIETTVPAVPTFKGPYQKWSDLRPYFVSLLEGMED